MPAAAKDSSEYWDYLDKLSRLGYSNAGITRFQADNGLALTGEINDDTANAIDALSTVVGVLTIQDIGVEPSRTGIL